VLLVAAVLVGAMDAARAIEGRRSAAVKERVINEFSFIRVFLSFFCVGSARSG
jgi:hypothetical protein